MPNLTRGEAQEALDRLNAHFGMRVKMQFTNCQAGHYRLRNNTMRIGRYEWRGIYGVVHEFAHALVYKRPGRDRGNHGRHFYACLMEVVEFFHGSPELYSWHTEYKTLWKWAVNDGYCSVDYRVNGKGIHAHLSI